MRSHKCMPNETREFKIVANDKVCYDSYRLFKFEAHNIVFNTLPLTCEGVCRVQLVRTPRSTIPPWALINAFEIHMVVE